MRSAVRLVWAQAHGGVIGSRGALPWRLPEDLRLFRTLTLGSTVVMGRRTWLSLPPRVRPLPGRRNVVLSTTLTPDEAGVEVATSIDEVLRTDGDLWGIGGAAVYAALLPHAAEVVVTEVDARFDGDTWAPPLGEGWQPGRRVPEDGWLSSTSGLPFRVTWWRRPTATAGDVPARLAEWLADVGGAAQSQAGGVGRFDA